MKRARFKKGVHRHAIVIRLPESARADPAAILSLPLKVGMNGMVPLSRVARIDEVRAVEPILRDDGKRRAALMVNLQTRDVEGYVADARAKIAQQVHLPEGYTISFGGQFKQLEAARARLLIVVPTTLVLIFALVYFALGSVRQAAIVYSGIPFAVTGGVLALALRGMPFSITAAIGFIALSGRGDAQWAGTGRSSQRTSTSRKVARRCRIRRCARPVAAGAFDRPGCQFRLRAHGDCIRRRRRSATSTRDSGYWGDHHLNTANVGTPPRTV